MVRKLSGLYSSVTVSRPSIHGGDLLTGVSLMIFFTHPGFPEYFDDNSGKIVEVRKVMWALRMPKMPKQAWETRF
jgi:hypothetical protein